MMVRDTPPIFRFAPSPNGALHLGHALSAVLNFKMAQESGGRFLLRIEDIDQTRCTPELEQAIFDDLTWLGLTWEQPVRRQSEHFDEYAAALAKLEAEGLVYRSYLTRGEIKNIVAASEAGGTIWPRDPDGAPLFPPREFEAHAKREHDTYAIRLDMQAALSKVGELSWSEMGADGNVQHIKAYPARWGDIVLARRDVPTSYHLSVVVDDDLQNITHVVRGKDLYEATAVHVLLQKLLGLQTPNYQHHRLILGEDGLKLSKSNNDTRLASLRAAGKTPSDIFSAVGVG